MSLHLTHSLTIQTQPLNLEWISIFPIFNSLLNRFIARHPHDVLHLRNNKTVHLSNVDNNAKFIFQLKFFSVIVGSENLRVLCSSSWKTGFQTFIIELISFSTFPSIIKVDNNDIRTSKNSRALLAIIY